MSALTGPHPRIIVAAALALLAAALGLLAAVPPARAQSTGMIGAATLKAADGGEIYHRICQGCHMPNGQGAKGAGTYPALAGDRALASSQFMAVTILDGRRNMPAFGKDRGGGFFFATPSLTDEQIAAVINYVRTHFGNHYKDRITAAEVEALNHAH